MGIEKQYGERRELLREVAECYVSAHNFIRAKEFLLDAIAAQPERLDLRVLLCQVLNKSNQADDVPNLLP